MVTLLSVLLLASENAAAQIPSSADPPAGFFTVAMDRAYSFLFNALSSPIVAALLQHIGGACALARVSILAPVLRVTVAVCLVMLVMQITEKLFVGAISVYVKVFRRRPEKVYEWKPLEEDVEMGDGAYPMVLVQIPMYNEKEVYQLSIGAACMLSWPRERFIIQVLDDSTDLSIKELVKAECRVWAEAGMNIKYEVRDNRKGYKAGALKEGMKHSYVQQCEYIAMFDADFQPEPDFLQRTIPFLVYNPRLALVQSRWKFVNSTECLMTRMQEMSLNYHFKVEQEGGSSSFAFFGYNGTAGVWRIAAIYDAGGWNDRTTVEDMDLAVRAGLKGWKFVYVGDVKVKSELPSTFKAYRFQQHRWSCGPANLFRKMALEIIKNKNVSLLMKIYLIYYFFFLGKIVAHTLTFIFFCTVIPLSVLAPEVGIPQWGLVYVPLIITICKAIETPRSLHLSVFWVLFENAMSFHRLKAAMTGLLEAGRVNEWVVTEKLGDAHKVKPSGEGIDKATKQGDIHEVLLPPIKTPKKVINRFWKRSKSLPDSSPEAQEERVHLGQLGNPSESGLLGQVGQDRLGSPAQPDKVDSMHAASEMHAAAAGLGGARSHALLEQDPAEGCGPHLLSPSMCNRGTPQPGMHATGGMHAQAAAHPGGAGSQAASSLCHPGIPGVGGDGQDPDPAVGSPVGPGSEPGHTNPAPIGPAAGPGFRPELIGPANETSSEALPAHLPGSTPASMSGLEPDGLGRHTQRAGPVHAGIASSGAKTAPPFNFAKAVSGGSAPAKTTPPSDASKTRASSKAKESDARLSEITASDEQILASMGIKPGEAKIDAATAALFPWLLGLDADEVGEEYDSDFDADEVGEEYRSPSPPPVRTKGKAKVKDAGPSPVDENFRPRRSTRMRKPSRRRQ